MELKAVHFDIQILEYIHNFKKGIFHELYVDPF